MPDLAAAPSPARADRRRSPADRRSSRAARPRALAALVPAVLLLLAGLLGLLPAPAHAAPPSQVEVTDGTGHVDPELLEAELEDLDVRQDVHLVVLVLDVTETGASPEQEEALEDAARAQVRADSPALLAEDGTWSDGTVVLALDPEHGLAGTYAGADVALEESGIEAVEDAMAGTAEDGSASEAVLAGAEVYAALLDRPWWRHPAAVTAEVLLFLAAATIAVVLGLRRSAARRAADEALPRHRAFLERQGEIGAAARALPVGSPYARAARAAHERVTEDLARAARLREDLPATDARPPAWGVRRDEKARAEELAQVVARLEAATTEIVATSDLLRRTGQWRSVWRREMQPLRDSLGALSEVEALREGMTPAEDARAAHLLALGGDVAAELTSLTARLEAGEIDPDPALEELDTLTRELTAAVDDLAAARLDALAEDEEERELLRADLPASTGTEESPGLHRSVRARRRALEHPEDGPADSTEGSTADGTVDCTADGVGAAWRLSPVLGYARWHRESADGLAAHRARRTPQGSGPQGDAQQSAGQ